MEKICRPGLLFSLAFLLAETAFTQSVINSFDRSRYTIASETIVLPNGLTVIVHEDHSVPVVSFNIWYHVGSRNEKPGKTGFAHLFEHFFFNGSKNYPHGFREAMDDVGANNRNGTTNNDRTNFFEDVPVSALERTLYLEADRMGYVTLSKEMLERERGVVQNEKRQGENEPLGKITESLPAKLYPLGHPYSWSTIGSMDDLNGATLEDIKEWFHSYYGPNNAVIGLAGDITPARAKELMTKYFGTLPPVPPISRVTSWVPALPENIREEAEDRIPEPVISRIYHIPGWNTKEMPYFRILSGALAGSKSSTLTRQLVYEKQLASEVASFIDDSELAGQLNIVVTVKHGVNPDLAEKEMDAVINSIIQQGPSGEEIERAKSRILATFSRRIERLGGFGGRSDVLAESMTFGRSSTAYLDQLEQLATAKVNDVQSAAAHWLNRPHYTLVAYPFKDDDKIQDKADRSALPSLGSPPAIAFPKIQRATLKNGMKVMLLERRSVPIVNVTLAVDAGFASDKPSTAGTASLAVDLLDKGTATRDLFAISNELDMIGAQLSTFTRLDLSYVKVNALSQNLLPSVALLADVVLHPAFPENQFNILKDQRLSEIDFEKSSPDGTVSRNFPALIYGREHPYGLPQSGNGYTETVKNISRKNLIDWHQQWFKPNNSFLIVSGNVSMVTLLPILEKAFGDWKSGSAPEKKLKGSSATKGGVVYLIDRPEAEQSVIAAGHISVPGGKADEIALETVLKNFGGMSTCRLNRNLRLDKHWSYGAAGFLRASRSDRLFEVYAPVQTNKTKESMIEIQKEIKGLAGDRPLAGEEYASIMRNMSLQLPARFSTLQSLDNAASQIINYSQPDDYWQSYGEKVRTLTEPQLNKVAKDLVHPEQIVWLVVGDRKKIEKGIRELMIGEVVFLDGDGNVVK